MPPPWVVVVEVLEEIQQPTLPLEIPTEGGGTPSSSPPAIWRSSSGSRAPRPQGAGESFRRDASRRDLEEDYVELSVGKVQVVEFARRRRSRQPSLPAETAVATPDCRQEDPRRRVLAIRPARRVHLDSRVVPEARGVFASVSRLVVLVVVALVALVPGYRAAGRVRVLAEKGSHGGLRNATATRKKKKKKKQ